MPPDQVGVGSHRGRLAAARPLRRRSESLHKRSPRPQRLRLLQQPLRKHWITCSYRRTVTLYGTRPPPPRALDMQNHGRARTVQCTRGHMHSHTKKPRRTEP